MKDIYVLHEYGDKRHFESLQFYANKKGKNVYYREFTPFKQFIKGVLKRDGELLKKAFINLFFLINLFITRDKIVILGAAPYDFRILLFLFIKKRHKLIYFSSWPYWNREKYPKKLFFPLQFYLWERFLNDVKAVMVSKTGMENISKYTKDVTNIPHVVDINVFKSMRKRKNAKLNIVYVGRLTENKGLNLIINLIEDPLLEDKIHWSIVGWGDYEEKIKRLANNKENVTFYGKVNCKKKLADIYNMNDLLLLPSIRQKNWEELFGIVIIEAMACGVIPIASAHTGPREIIKDKKNGFLLNETSEQEIKTILLRLTHNKEILDDMRELALKDIREKYTVVQNSIKWGKVVESFHE